MGKVSNLFYGNNPKYKEIEEEIKNTISNSKNFLNETTSQSIRAIGDSIQVILEEKFWQMPIMQDIIGEHWENFARRSMEDLAFEDKSKIYYAVDVKTHNINTSFNMPNLISIQRLVKFYEDDTNYFVILMIKYGVNENKDNVDVKEVHFVPIEFLSWDSLTIGALGWGQIQIKNSNKLVIQKSSRKEWMLKLFDMVESFYESELGKIGNRKQFFQTWHEKWDKKKDIWK